MKNSTFHLAVRVTTHCLTQDSTMKTTLQTLMVLVRGGETVCQLQRPEKTDQEMPPRKRMKPTELPCMTNTVWSFHLVHKLPKQTWCWSCVKRHDKTVCNNLPITKTDGTFYASLATLQRIYSIAEFPKWMQLHHGVSCGWAKGATRLSIFCQVASCHSNASLFLVREFCRSCTAVQHHNYQNCDGKICYGKQSSKIRDHTAKTSWFTAFLLQLSNTWMPHLQTNFFCQQRC